MLRGLIIAGGLVVIAAIIGAALTFGGGRFTWRGLLLAIAAAVVAVAALAIPLLIGVFIGLLRYARNMK